MTEVDQFQPINSPTVNDIGLLRRLASYLNWPSSAQVRPSALSISGFVYEGEGERTRCVACGIVVEHWQRGDRPQEIHRRRSPTCPYVIAESQSGSSNRDVDDVGSTFQSVPQQLQPNEPRPSVYTDNENTNSTTLRSSTSSASGPSLQQPSRTSSSSSSTTPASVDRSRPDLVQLRSESVRLSTFHDWPSAAGRIVQPRDLAAAGLFYTGQADRVQCAFCRGYLRSWRRGDSPAEEHRRYFPDCPLVCAATTAGNITSDSSASADSQCSTNQSQRDHLTTGEPASKSSVDNSGSGSTMPARSDATNHSSETLESAAAAAAAAAAALSSATEDSTAETDEDYETELAENRRLRETRTCKVCMDREVNTVFLPCGHLVCCDTCSPALRNCAMCRSLIRGTVKVFLG